MAKTIAKITGTALRPGVSRNGRLYTREMIASAVTRAQARIATGESPMTMLTHHLAGDDSTKIVGRVAKWSVGPDGEARYESMLSDTPHGRTIAALADPNGGESFLRNVSIRGGWLGSVKRVQFDGQMVETGDDLELDGLDFTKSPGVVGADIDSLTYTDGSLPAESDGRTLIYETVSEARVQITEEAPQEVKEKAAALKSGGAAAPQTKASNYADPGYQPDKMKRYALDTKAQAKAAWSYINQTKNAGDYTAAQLKRIKDRIKSALTKFGVKVDAKEGYLISPVEAITENVTEYMGDYPPMGGFSVNIDNGMVSISVSSWRIDPADLELCARAAMDGACQALAAMDPDDDGDIDTPGSESATDAGVTEHASPDSTTDQAALEDEETGTVADQPTTQAADAPQSTPAPAATPPVETPAPAATAPATAPGGITLTDDQFTQLLAKLGQGAPPAPAAELVGAGAPAESAPAVPVGATVEAAPAAPVTETTEQMVARLVAEGVKAALPLAVQEAAQAGGAPARKGLVAPVGESTAATAEAEFPAGWPTDESGAPMDPSKMPRSQVDKLFRPNLEQAVLGPRSIYRQD